ncbi:hypothetical protein AVBRAN12642_02285 [Campylobacter sp. RM12642]|uniref:hypothetical protein n=1 Tax=unclassified Campylobacter TaxID=2593542 RepID=UPI001DF575CE|nr:hypothetical protein [Campylobacter sp. RM12642]MBZ8006659.1 hypothetical protein [Campylobacter sp. RM9334]
MKNLINNLEGLKQGEFAKAFHKNAIDGTTNTNELLKYAKNDILKKFILIAITTIIASIVSSIGIFSLLLTLYPWVFIFSAIYIVIKLLKKFKIF